MLFLFKFDSYIIARFFTRLLYYLITTGVQNSFQYRYYVIRPTIFIIRLRYRSRGSTGQRGHFVGRRTAAVGAPSGPDNQNRRGRAHFVLRIIEEQVRITVKKRDGCNILH